MDPWIGPAGALDWTWTVWAAAAAATFAGAVIRGFTGFGFALIFIGVLSLVAVPADVDPLPTLLDWGAGLRLIPAARRDVHWQGIRWLALGAAAGVVALSHSWLFVFPMVVVVLSYGLAIPNVLARALDHYTDRAGTAGALLGLLYYTMLATGLLLAGWSQNLGAVLMCCSVVALPLAASAHAASTRVHARA